MILSKEELEKLENIFLVLKRSKLPEMPGESALIWAKSVNDIWDAIKKEKEQFKKAD